MNNKKNKTYQVYIKGKITKSDLKEEVNLLKDFGFAYNISNKNSVERYYQMVLNKGYNQEKKLIERLEEYRWDKELEKIIISEEILRCEIGKN